MDYSAVASLTILVNTYGFKHVYTSLMQIGAVKLVEYTDEVAFINALLEPCGHILGHATDAAEAGDAAEAVIVNLADEPVKNVFEKTIEITSEALVETEERPSRKIKVIKKNGRMIKVKNSEEPPVAAQAEPSPSAPSPLPEANPEAPPKRTAKEIKKWQRDQEAVRRKHMKANNITLASVLVPETIQAYLSDGKTYAWIAREVTGQKEEDVSKWCKEKGLKKGIVI
jgi:hypothetical protein